MTNPTPAHDQTKAMHYTVHYPEHLPRDKDPHYAAFNAFRKHHIKDAVCYVGDRIGFDTCSTGPLELHHTVLEFATINLMSAKALHKDFPEVPEDASADFISEWAESSPGNFRFLCARHHRSNEAGAHSVSHADWEAALHAPGLLG